MRKEEIISLVLIIAAVVVLIIGLQMDYGSEFKDKPYMNHLQPVPRS